MKTKRQGARQMPTICFSREHECPFGPIWSQWTAVGLYKLQWGDDSTANSLSAGVSRVTQQQSDLLDEKLDEFFASGNADFQQIEIDPFGWTPFSAAVYQCCREIPAGTTVTYKELAQRSGSERASRAVGSAMARNRVPIVIPCHRVVATGGQLCGFSAPGGLRTKQFLLDLESCPKASDAS